MARTRAEAEQDEESALSLKANGGFDDVPRLGGVDVSANLPVRSSSLYEADPTVALRAHSTIGMPPIPMRPPACEPLVGLLVHRLGVLARCPPGSSSVSSLALLVSLGPAFSSSFVFIVVFFLALVSNSPSPCPLPPALIFFLAFLVFQLRLFCRGNVAGDTPNNGWKRYQSQNT
ncbi:hypothetical protein FPV67DRAFT_1782571 [Lyophyllum atratum]|nr:hypothetical protein FPV67DRAFT_1782571 [Lyophyllum atratum]